MILARYVEELEAEMAEALERVRDEMRNTGHPEVEGR